MKSLSIRQDFPQYKSMGAIFCHSRASNSKANIPVWPKFELRRDFMPVMITCKFDEDPIKIDGTIDQTRPNMGFFGTQWQVILVDSPFWSDF